MSSPSKGGLAGGGYRESADSHPSFKRKFQMDENVANAAETRSYCFLCFASFINTHRRAPEE